MSSITDRAGNEIALLDSVLEVSGETVCRINVVSVPAAMLLVVGGNPLIPAIQYLVNGTEITFTPPVHYMQKVYAIDLANGSLAWVFLAVDTSRPRRDEEVTAVDTVTVTTS